MVYEILIFFFPIPHSTYNFRLCRMGSGHPGRMGSGPPGRFPLHQVWREGSRMGLVNSDVYLATGPAY